MGEPGWRRLDELGLLRPLGGSLRRLEPIEPDAPQAVGLVAVFGESLLAPPHLARAASLRPHDALGTPPS